jgi:WD40 repeat protein
MRSSQIMNSSFRYVIYASSLFLLQALDASPEKPNFEDDLIPLFEESCNSCHNPDKAKGGLDLTSMNGILAGGSSGEVALPGESSNSLLYLLAARLKEPHMPPNGGKIADSKLALIKLWIDQGLLPTASGKPMVKKKSSVNLALGSATLGKPEGPPPMPEYLSLEPSVVSNRAFAPSAMATAPWSPIVAVAGQKQVLLYHTETLRLLGILPFPEGFIESLSFSRNGKIVLASGGRGGKSGRVAGWDLKTGKRILTLGEEYDTILSADLSADQSLVAIGGPSKVVKVFDLASGEILYQIKKHSEWVTQVQFSPDGILLATGDRNGGLHVWEARTGNAFYTLDGHNKAITSLSWRADSNVLLSASEDSSVRIWEMVNGKQVRSWNAHGIGTLSAHYDQKGKITTAGRDKTVKYWDGDGKALKTLGRFEEIAMETRLSHDGSRIIAGDWSGEISVWQTSDGKKIGSLGGNPPHLSSRLAQAMSQKSNHEKALGVARSKQAPLAQAEALAVKKETESATKAKLADTNLASALTNLQKAQTALQQAQTEEKAKALDKTNKQKDKDAKTQALAQAKQNHLSHSNAHNDWKNRANFRSEQVSALHEAHRKTEEAKERNKDDAGFQDALAKQREALTAMEKAFGHARDSAIRHKGEMDKYAKLVESSTQSLTAATQALATASQALAQAQAKSLASDKALKDATSLHAQAKTAKDQALASLDSSRKSLAAAREALKGPTAELEQAKRNFEASTRDVSRWQAELVNVERHVELNNLRELESELGELKDLLTETEVFKNSAIQAVQAASESLRLVPEKIARAEKLVQDKQGKVKSLETNKSTIVEAKEKKTAFIKNVDQLALLAKKEAEAKQDNSVLAQANAKFEETIALLKQDLSNTENQIASKQQELVAAENAVSVAKKGVETAMKLRESAPKVLAEKELALAEAKKKHEENKVAFDSFKKKVDQQSALTQTLLKKYLDALPK